jgi:hypothetical protein
LQQPFFRAAESADKEKGPAAWFFLFSGPPAPLKGRAAALSTYKYLYRFQIFGKMTALSGKNTAFLRINKFLKIC